MDDLTVLFESSPYSFDKDEKRDFFNKRIQELTEFHYWNCEKYKKILDALNYDVSCKHQYDEQPFLPVRLFKEIDLLSVDKSDIVKTMTSSGTSGQTVSKIFVDRNTAINQQKTLVKIVSDFTGAARMPMLIIDNPSVIKDRNMFSARGAGILGFSLFGSDRVYAFDDDMNLNVSGIEKFLQKHVGETIFLFGFTFMIWQFFYQKLVGLNYKIDLSNGIMIHGGGWKKLASEAVSPEEFKAKLYDVCGIKHVYDYYGMVEQTGCIYMECEYGHLHTSNFSDVIIRNSIDFSICGRHETGIIQVVSTLPESYPGHNLLTEDEGEICGEDDCPCGRKGQYFIVHGRLKNAEIRGCSDTYAAKF